MEGNARVVYVAGAATAVVGLMRTEEMFGLAPALGEPYRAQLEAMIPIQFTIESVPDRIEKLGDLWAGILDAKHDLGRLVGAES